MIERKSATEIETMARAGRVVADTLALLGEAIRPGMTTHDLDQARRMSDWLVRIDGGRAVEQGPTDEVLGAASAR